MDITYITSLILGVVFLSAGISKSRKFDEHLIILEEYKLLRKKRIPLAGAIEVFLEVLIGFLLITGFFKIVGAIFAILLLVTFSSVISMKIIKGKNEIDCGCGGVLGNHKLSWFIVIRNAFLILMSLLQIFHNTNITSLGLIFLNNRFDYVDSYFITNTIYAMVILLFFIYFSKIIEVKKRVENLFQRS